MGFFGRFRRTLLVTAGLAVLYIISLFGVWWIGARNAWQKTEDLLTYACADLRDNIELVGSGALDIEAESIKRILKDATPRSVDEMQRLVVGCGLDSLHLVGSNGRVISSTESQVIGFDLATSEKTRPFLALTNGVLPSIHQTFMPSIRGDDSLWLYSGFSFRDGAFLLCGLSEASVAKLFATHEQEMMMTWQLGETGCYVIADDQTGRIVYDAFGFGARGRTLNEVGLGDAAKQPDSQEVTHVAHAFGERCYYRAFLYLGLRVIPLVPHREFFLSVRVTTLMTAVILLIVFIIFVIAFNRTVAAHRAIVALRAIEDAKREKDMQMATSIQKHSLPSVFPPFPKMSETIDLFALMNTAKEVGGDFYDFYFVGPNQIALVMADVSGKGIPAAMFMMRAKATLQGFLKSGVGLAAAVAETNDRLCTGNADGMFVTAWIGVYDVQTGELQFVNAGHTPPILQHADGTVSWIRARSGLPLASLEGRTYRLHTIQLAPGDALLIYTDGITEAQNHAQELYGETRLEAVVRRFPSDKSARDLCHDVQKDVVRFVAGAEQADDITLLAFRVKSLVS